MAQTQLVPKLAHLANSMDSTLLLEKIFSYGFCFVLTLALKQEFEQMAYLEEVCDCRLNDGYSAGYRRENGPQPRGLWGRGYVSSAVFVELENIEQKFHTLCEEERDDSCN